MLKTTVKHLSILLAAILVMASCALEQGGGSLTVNFADLGSKTLTPGISLDAASYTVQGTGPFGNSFSENTSDSPMSVDYLAAGSWEISVDAFNGDGVLIATGTNTVNVLEGQKTTVYISLLPPEGFGSFNVDVFWDYSLIQDPTVSTSLTNSSGTSFSLDAVSVEDGHSLVASANITTGYYVMSLQLLDESHILAGAVEAVKILDGQETSGQYTFTDLNFPAGNVDIDITIDLQDPLIITLDTTVSQIIFGQTLTLTADAGLSDVVYTWYLNGISQSTGASYTTAADQAPGTYRLDVVGFTTDGSRAGSTSHIYTVVEN